MVEKGSQTNQKEMSQKFRETTGKKKLYDASEGDIYQASLIMERLSSQADTGAQEIINIGNLMVAEINGLIDSGERKKTDDNYLIEGMKAKRRSEIAAVAAYARWHKNEVGSDGKFSDQALEKVKNKHLRDVLSIHRLSDKSNVRQKAKVREFEQELQEIVGNYSNGSKEEQESLAVNSGDSVALVPIGKQDGDQEKVIYLNPKLPAKASIDIWRRGKKIAKAVAGAALVAGGTYLLSLPGIGNVDAAPATPDHSSHPSQTTPNSGKPENGKSTPKPQGNRGNGVGVPGGPQGNPTETGKSQGDHRGAPGDPGNNHASEIGCLHGDPDCATPKPKPTDTPKPKPTDTPKPDKTRCQRTQDCRGTV